MPLSSRTAITVSICWTDTVSFSCFDFRLLLLFHLCSLIFDRHFVSGELNIFVFLLRNSFIPPNLAKGWCSSAVPFFSSTIVPLLVYIARKKWGSAKEDSISSGRLMCNVHASLCVATNYAFMKAHCARQLPRFWHWNVSNVMHPYNRMWLVASKISRFTFVCVFDFVFIHFCDAK